MRNHTIRPQLDQVFPPPYLNQLQKVTFQKNDYICTQGQAITELTYILSGKVKIVRSLFNGKEHILETLNQPQILGDVELMTNQPAGSSVIALEEVQAVQLPLNNKEELLKDPVFSLPKLDVTWLWHCISKVSLLQRMRATLSKSVWPPIF